MHNQAVPYGRPKASLHSKIIRVRVKLVLCVKDLLRIKVQNIVIYLTVMPITS